MAAPVRWLPPAIVSGGLLPLGLLATQALSGGLGPNPIERVLNQTGLLALVLLLSSLACTPLRLLAGWTWPMRIRKHLGLLGFTYGMLHFLTYTVVDQGLALGALVEDVAKRPFITVGLAALLLLVPLAATSTAQSVRRMGFVAWQRLHRLAYVAAALGVVHFSWRVKRDVTEPALYGAVLAMLLAVRIAEAVRKRRAQRSA